MGSDTKFIVRRDLNTPCHAVSIPDYSDKTKPQLLAIAAEQTSVAAEAESIISELDGLPENLGDLRAAAEHHGRYAEAIGQLDLAWRKRRAVAIAIKAIAVPLEF